VDVYEVMKDGWDCLIVLDACRYDYFAELWHEFLPDGELTKTRSAGSSTVEWRDRSFPSRYDDVAYVSANPYINSVRAVEGFLGTEHFRHVDDVWADGWDAARGTVLPQSVTDAALRLVRHGPPKRLIVHYLQPHAPYPPTGSGVRGFPAPDVRSGRALEGLSLEPAPPRMRGAVLRLLAGAARRLGVMGNRPDWRLRPWLGLGPASPMDAVRRAHGNAGLREAYRRNLGFVLSHVRPLVDSLTGRIVITADHGELLGEGGCYSHWSGSDHPLLREVPRLAIERGSDAPAASSPEEGGETASQAVCGASESRSGGEAEKIRERLKALGYVDSD
jgi:hypothetical protein